MLSSLDGAKAMAQIKDTGKLVINIAGVDEELCEEDLLIETKQSDSFETNSDKGITVVLDKRLTDELIEEGFVREIISKIQTMRKEAGFEVMDYIRVSCGGNNKIAQILDKNAEYIKSEVLCADVVTNGATGTTKEWSINDEKVTLGVEKI